MDSLERARRSASTMWGNDPASSWAGFSLDSVEPGKANLSMSIESHHCNGHGICHGGIIFMLADSAFAFACNSYNEVVVAQHAAISFLAPARQGDRLTASAREISRTGRSGLYDVSVSDQDGRKIAEFRGHSRIIPGRHFEEEQGNEGSDSEA